MQHFSKTKKWLMASAILWMNCAFWICAGCALSLWGCNSSSESRRAVDFSSDEKPERELSGAFERLDVQHLANAIRIHRKVISGGVPEGRAAFEELKHLGIKTIISVDGIKPDVTSANQFGMAYIHLPHGYNGVSEIRMQELAKAVLEKDGPIYIHCHHGKHRSPTAAAVACVGAGLIPAQDALSVLKFATASPSYLGLYQSAALAQRYTEQQLRELKVDYRECAAIPPLAETMVELDQVFERVAQPHSVGWKLEDESSAAVMAHDALLIGEQFAEMQRTEEVQSASVEFHELVREGELAAVKLEQLLNAPEGFKVAKDKTRVDRLSQAFDRLKQNCNDCHQKFRDMPLIR